jgi:hypothetical protein
MMDYSRPAFPGQGGITRTQAAGGLPPAAWTVGRVTFCCGGRCGGAVFVRYGSGCLRVLILRYWIGPRRAARPAEGRFAGGRSLCPALAGPCRVARPAEGGFAGGRLPCPVLVGPCRAARPAEGSFAGGRSLCPGGAGCRERVRFVAGCPVGGIVQCLARRGAVEYMGKAAVQRGVSGAGRPGGQPALCAEPRGQPPAFDFDDTDNRHNSHRHQATRSGLPPAGRLGNRNPSFRRAAAP